MSEVAKEVVISLKNVNKTFRILEDNADSVKGKLFGILRKNHKRMFPALKDINLELHKGDCFGLIGRNGSGKSTLTKVMAGTYLSDKGGEVFRNGTVMLLTLGLGMSHELSGRENIYLTTSLLGLSRKHTDTIYKKIVEFAELEDFIETKIKYYSTGMKQRLAFSVAVNASADIIFLDEVFAVGDQKFKEKAEKVFEEAFIHGKTVVMVSHSLQNIKKYCNRAAFIDKGEIIYCGDPAEAIRQYEALP